MKQFLGIGLMSGTSLDGLDIAFVGFEKGGKWSYEIIQAETIKYDQRTKTHLHECFNYSAREFQHFHHAYGVWLGKTVAEFIHKYQIKAQFIASHGHTVFHEPKLGYTTQIGSGVDIYAQTRITTICDFRTVDVALGGQGAPLVPLGDKELFSQYNFLLNLGGIANITVATRKEETIAYDITVANMALNHFAQILGLEYDENGKIASKGKLHETLFQSLNDLDFFKGSHPKSLGREFFENEFLPLIKSFIISTEDILTTLCHHIAYQISIVTNSIKTNTNHHMLITGGGALNGHLIKLIKEYCTTVDIVVPDRKTIEYKEALIFAFLGLKRLLNEPNCLGSVTGAKEDVLGGAIYGNTMLF